MRKPDVVVIGGGAIGAAVTYYLSTLGAKTLLLEGADLASGASGACGGYVWLCTKKPGIHLKLAQASLELLRSLATKLGDKIECSQSGELILIESDTQSSDLEDFVNSRIDAGIEFTILSAEDAQRLQPALDCDRVTGALYGSLGLHINPMNLVFALVDEARKNNAEVRMHAKVEDIHIASGHVQSVQTNHGSIPTDFVVNAAGVNAPAVGRMVDINIPIVPMRGQIMVTESVAPAIRIPSLEFRYLTIKRNRELLERAVPFGVTCSVSQNKNGNVYIGTSKEFAGNDNRVSFDALRQIAKKAFSFYPFLSHVRVIRAYAGLRPYTADGLPIVGQVDGRDGIIVAAGHGGDGIALSLITGRIVSEMITTGETSYPVDEVSPMRFCQTD